MRVERRWRLGGRVQGVGFRPFVYRLASEHRLTGWVRNLGGEVEIHAEGAAEQVRVFGEALLSRAPPAAAAHLLGSWPAADEACEDFRILASTTAGDSGAHIPADLFTCDQCLAELLDPRSRRHRHPFINCTQCGPRYTLIRALPYDRRNTAMDRFPLCPDCLAEYRDPMNRRFHAEPLACPHCGPVLRWSGADTQVQGNEGALAYALHALRTGQIVAVRGVGGYHLLCDARDEDVVARLRLRKSRPAKPFAVMLPWSGPDGLQAARALAQLRPEEALALQSPTRPIVLVRRIGGAALARSVAPGLEEVGLMLPYSPLHHLLLADFGAPVVATSGNLSGEPVLTAPEEAQARLAGIADGFLHHDRPILRPADDPVVRVSAGAVRPLRLGRGNAPLEIALAQPIARPLLAVGAYLKTTIALGWGNRAVISPHIGELSSPRGRAVFAQLVQDLQRLYGVRAACIVHDHHPDFPGTRWALESGLPTCPIWHHHAHASALAGECPGNEQMLCFAWDGLGLGPGRQLWGGEALLGRPGEWQHVCSIRPLRLPGGERTARQPWRAALAACWESGLPWPEGERLAGPMLRRAWENGLNAPATTSVGRLFDAAAALLGQCRVMSYEAEAAMLLEALAGGAGQSEPAALPLTRKDGVWRTDWAPLLPMLLDARRPLAQRAAVFHVSLAAALRDQALAVRAETGVQKVGLCGGVFQNRLLCEHAQSLLSAAGFEVVLPRLLPANDAAISFGQIIEAAALLPRMTAT